MVFLVLTRSGYEELVAQLGQPPSPLWINAGVLSTLELAQFRQTGYEVTAFTHAIDIYDNFALETAIGIVQEHHAGQRIWVEYVSSP